MATIDKANSLLTELEGRRTRLDIDLERVRYLRNHVGEYSEPDDKSIDREISEIGRKYSGGKTTANIPKSLSRPSGSVQTEGQGKKSKE